MVEKIIVASKNPAKIKAVEAGFRKMFPKVIFEVEGVSVLSGVSDQPMSSKETLSGAMNRAEEAKKLVPEGNYWVGLEGGLEKSDDEMEAFAWVVVKSKSKTGKSRTSSFYLPERVKELINQGKELGEADDIVFGKTDSKKKNGAVGILTGDVIDRASYYAEAVVLALIPFKNPELY